MGEAKVIKPEDVRTGDRVRLTVDVGSWVTSYEGISSRDGQAGDSGIWLGTGRFHVYEASRLELLDRPKSPGQVAYEAYQREAYGRNVRGEEWEGYDSLLRTGWEAAAQAVLDARADS